MTNPWFRRIDYEPTGRRKAAVFGRVVRTADPESDLSRTAPNSISVTHSLVVTRQSWTDRILTLSGHLLTSSVLAAAAVSILATPKSTPERHVDAMPQTISIKVERYTDGVAAEARANGIGPAEAGLENAWNQGGGRFRFGSRRNEKQTFYVPIPRPGLESEFRDLEFNGLSGMKLHEILVPRKWSEQFLAALKYKWAEECNIKPKWIDEFSSFPRHTLGAPVNECHPGGTCIVLSYACRGDTFDDLN